MKIKVQITRIPRFEMRVPPPNGPGSTAWGYFCLDCWRWPVKAALGHESAPGIEGNNFVGASACLHWGGSSVLWSRHPSSAWS
jgi:hypothetical protein